MAIPLTTERLLLREIVPEDAVDIFEYSQNPTVGRNAGWKPHESLDETREIMQTIFLGQKSVWGMVQRETKKLIGSIGLIPDPKRENESVLMLGYALGEPYWGRGLMTEAAQTVCGYGFGELRLTGISATTFPDNARSQRVLQKLGFQYEGSLQQAERLYTGEIMGLNCYFLNSSHCE